MLGNALQAIQPVNPEPSSQAKLTNTKPYCFSCHRPRHPSCLLIDVLHAAFNMVLFHTEALLIVHCDAFTCLHLIRLDVF